MTLVFRERLARELVLVNNVINIETALHYITLHYITYITRVFASSYSFSNMLNLFALNHFLFGLLCFLCSFVCIFIMIALFFFLK